MVINFNAWDLNKNTLKPIFGNRKNYAKFLAIQNRLRLKILYGIN